MKTRVDWASRLKVSPTMRSDTVTVVSPKFSIVVCTDGRAAALSNTLRCLSSLDGNEFEVCVVCGPTKDATQDVLAVWSGRIKIAHNAERNLSISRNIGIAIAAGNIVAFVDDDGLPERRWLQDLEIAFLDPKVAGAGGVVMDHTGAQVHYRCASADRMGNADWQRTIPAINFNFPMSYNFPYLQGTNSAFRRDILLDVGGFDEEYDFYLDETDLCCRLIDQGWLICQLPDAVVHHKFLSSAIRTSERATRVLYPVLKNKLYFSLLNNHGHYPIGHAMEDMVRFVQAQEAYLRSHLVAGRVHPADMAAFQPDVDQAWVIGLERGLSGQRRLMDDGLPSRIGKPFLEFPRQIPVDGRKAFAFISQEYPPGAQGGIGRYIHQLAREISDQGHHVHVLTRGEGHDRVDFEDGVWVHRLIPRQPDTLPPSDLDVPEHIWSHSETMMHELRRIAAALPIDVVYAPIWDCEGVAVIVDGRWPLVIGLQTTLHFWMESHPQKAGDVSFQRDFAEPMLKLEKWMLNNSDGIHAISAAIVRDISSAYGIQLPDARTAIVPLGLEDWSTLPSAAPEPTLENVVRVLFVGRLEERKGIDLLLDLIPRMLERHPNLHFDIVGNDRIAATEGITYRQQFEAGALPTVGSRVHFHGEVSEERLRGFYTACDLFVAPSRFESFGLVLVEAMMFSKPIVACRCGGMVEVTEDGKTALLANPGDVVSLEDCLEQLVGNDLLRRTLGNAGRQRYIAHFAPRPMAEGVVELLRRAGLGTAERMAVQAI